MKDLTPDFAIIKDLTPAFVPVTWALGLSMTQESWGQVFHYHILICNQIMARPLRLEFARARYHVTCRGDRREDTSHDDAVCLN